MRKLVFAFLLLFLLVVTPAFAQDAMESSPSSDIVASTSSYTPSVTPTPDEYQLPYPGLLPDSPLYFIKVFRDRLIDFMVADPMKKAELYLLQADKRLVAADMLFANSKQELGESTLSKGENYFSEGIGKLKEAKKQGMDTQWLVDRYTESLDKHENIVKRLIGKSKGNIKTRLKNTKQRLDTFEIQVKALTLK